MVAPLTFECNVHEPPRHTGLGPRDFKKGTLVEKRPGDRAYKSAERPRNVPLPKEIISDFRKQQASVRGTPTSIFGRAAMTPERHTHRARRDSMGHTSPPGGDAVEAGGAADALLVRNDHRAGLTKEELRTVQLSLARLALSFVVFMYLLGYGVDFAKILETSSSSGGAKVIIEADLTFAEPKAPEITPASEVFIQADVEKLKQHIISDFNLTKKATPESAP